MFKRPEEIRIIGIATLESALIAVLLLSLLLGGFGISDYIVKNQRITQLLDKYINDQSLHPFRMNDAGVVLSGSEVENTIAEIRDRFTAELTEALGVNLREDHYIFEINFAVVSINSQTGRVEGWSLENRTTKTSGTLLTASTGRDVCDLSKRFRATIESNSESTSLAVPTGLWGTTSRHSYLPQTVILGARIIYSLTDTFTGYVINGLGVSNDQFICDCRIVTLRGEVT